MYRQVRHQNSLYRFSQYRGREKIAEELIQNEATAAKIANGLEAALHNHQIIDELAAVKTSLGKPGASLRAARIVLESIQ